MRQNLLIFPAAAVAIMAIILTTGCGEGDWQKPPITPSPAPAPTPQTATATGAPAAAAPPAQQTEAKADAAAKGGGRTVPVPLASLFSIKDRILFEITIPDGMRLYKFHHDGKAPATYDEFMRNFLRDQHIGLPGLPPATATFTIRPKND